MRSSRHFEGADSGILRRGILTRRTPVRAAGLSTLLAASLACATAALPPWLAAAQSAPPASDATSTAARSDLEIEADVLHQLAAVPALRNQAVSASTDNGTVSLTGTVSDDAAGQLAQTTAGAVPGVRAVVNHLHTGAVAAQTPATPYPGTVTAAPNPAAIPAEAPPYTAAEQPAPGSEGRWGQAGPPPDAVGGRIPPPPTEAQDGAAPLAAERPLPPPQRTEQSPSQPPLQPHVGYPMPPSEAGAYPAPPLPSSAPPAYGAYEAQRDDGGLSRGVEAYPQAQRPLTLPAGTLLTVRTSEPLDTRHLASGDYFQATAARDIFSGESLALPRGATLQGRILEVKHSGAFKGSAGLALQLTNLNLSGNAYPIATDTFVSDTAGKGGYTTANTAGGAAIGAIIGVIAGGGGGAAIGAVAGGATGVGVSAATPGPREVLPPETLLTFHLQAPVTIEPVSYREAQRLAASALPPRQPYLRPRPYAAPRPYSPYPPPYPYPY